MWLAYRDACPDPEARADFMPQLWQKIEAKRSESISVLTIFKRFAQACVAATAVMLALLSAMPGSQPAESLDLDSRVYTDILAADQTSEAYAIIHPASIGLVGDQN
jgi:hypothetical protein